MAKFGCVYAFLLVFSAAALVPENAAAQIVVDVVDQDINTTVAARVFMHAGGKKTWIGNTREGKPLTYMGDCQGKISVVPTFTVYKDQEPRFRDCDENLKFTLERTPIIGRTGRVATIGEARRKFADYPLVLAQLDRIETSVASGELAQLALASKALAEEMEEAGLIDQAQPFWDISAQTAVTVMASQQEEGADDSAIWLAENGDRKNFTPEAVAVIKKYQDENGLPAVGQIGDRTFRQLAMGEAVAENEGQGPR